MIGNKLEQEIIALYDRNIKAVYSINQIAKILKKKYPYINKKATSFIKGRIMNKIVIGRSYLCSLNLKNDRTILLLTINEINKKEDFFEKKEKLLSELEKIKNDFKIDAAVISKKEIMFVADDKSIEGKIKARITDFSVAVLNKKEFQERILNEKKILEDHIIPYNYEKYFEIIKEIEDKIELAYSPLFARVGNAE